MDDAPSVAIRLLPTHIGRKTALSSSLQRLNTVNLLKREKGSLQRDVFQCVRWSQAHTSQEGLKSLRVKYFASSMPPSLRSCNVCSGESEFAQRPEQAIDLFQTHLCKK
jgi:hypothetical protein